MYTGRNQVLRHRCHTYDADTPVTDVTERVTSVTGVFSTVTMAGWIDFTV